MSDSELIIPDWPAPGHIKAACTTRAGGVSEGPWSSLNLGSHVEDNVENVERNRQILADWVGLPKSSFEFLEQVHGTRVIELPATGLSGESGLRADGCVTSRRNTPCLVMTADCLPVLFCDRAGTRVAAAHAGWRGLCNGVLERTVEAFEAPGDVMAWLGPAIGQNAFEVGSEVRQAFLEHDAAAENAFTASNREGHFMADLYRLARQRLERAGLTSIYGGHWCTYTDKERFFSYRRDGRSGRMASYIFLS
ncbi:peptidoglycan editing factor PgeF [Marinobacter sp. CHS3-4]|uniref:peptidoglycan editing factor PgeF n=1 Tax=Marinobacter sp. CHS3-4 TaxID=3045174 RepID=UPI0024B62005|nr:peptidoglycan editing factor PgeF [Marinobacter sp. CHS3-4]MDI9246794.1 peptidoglycan editing factor PgeF [Marinobacter sp. CHS3-4]